MSDAPPPKVRFTSSVKESIVVLQFSREELIQVYLYLNFTLPRKASKLRQRRVAEQPACFLYRLRIPRTETVLRLDFYIGDDGWPDEIWVVKVERVPN